MFFLKYFLKCGQRQFIQKFPHYINNEIWIYLYYYSLLNKNTLQLLQTTAHCTCVRPYSFLTVPKTFIQPLQTSSKLSNCCWLRQLTVLPAVEGRWVSEGEGLAPKEGQTMDIQCNVNCTQQALSKHDERDCHVLSLEISSCNFRTASHCGQNLDMPMKSLGIHTLLLPKIGKGTSQVHKLQKVGPTLATIKKLGHLAVRGNTLTTATYLLHL
jgi:hypothetical protein